MLNFWVAAVTTSQKTPGLGAKRQQLQTWFRKLHSSPAALRSRKREILARFAKGYPSPAHQTCRALSKLAKHIITA